jgi:hypothetical protein
MAERKVLLLRLRPALHEALRRWANDEFRSVNGQLEYVVHRALRDAGRLPRGASASPGEGDAEGNGDDESGGEEKRPS